MKRTLIAAVLAAVVAYAVPSRAGAATYNLAGLIEDDASITLGDKTFSGFGFLGGNTFITPGIIGVTPVMENNGGYSLLFNGPMVSPTITDFSLFYTVTASGGNKITAIGQSFTPNFTFGAGLISITEQLKDPAGDPNTIVAWSNLYNSDQGDPAAEVGDAGDNLVLTPPLTSVNVQKDIYIYPGQSPVTFSTNGEIPPGSTGLSLIRQTFYQTPGVPDGGLTVGLLGFALVGLEGLRRKVQK